MHTHDQTSSVRLLLAAFGRPRNIDSAALVHGSRLPGSGDAQFAKDWPIPERILQCIFLLPRRSGLLSLRLSRANLVFCLLVQKSLQKYTTLDHVHNLGSLRLSRRDACVSSFLSGLSHEQASAFHLRLAHSSRYRNVYAAVAAQRFPPQRHENVRPEICGTRTVKGNTRAHLTRICAFFRSTAFVRGWALAVLPSAPLITIDLWGMLGEYKTFLS